MASLLMVLAIILIPIMMQIGVGSTALFIKFLEEQSTPLPMMPTKKIITALNIFIIKVLIVYVTS